MTKAISRRDALKRFSAAGAGALLNSHPVPQRQDAAIQVAGRTVEIAVTPVSEQTVRLSIVPLENGEPQPIPPDGSLAQQRWTKPVARLRALSRERSVRYG
jgi:hypothetical protein